MLRFRIARNIAPLRKPQSFGLPVLHAPSVLRSPASDLHFVPPRNTQQVIPVLISEAEPAIGLIAAVKSEQFNLLPQAGVRSCPIEFGSKPVEAYWPQIGAPDVQSLFTVFRPHLSTAGKNYSAQLRPGESRQHPLFGPEEAPKKKGGVRVIGGMSTGKGAIVTVWDALWPVLQPPLNFAFSEYLDLPSSLRPYQYDGVRFLADNGGALLGDDMGTGKTVQAVVALRILIQKGQVRKALIVCPLAVLPSWTEHLENWGRILNFSVVRGTKTERRLQWNTPAHAYLTTYDTLREDIEAVCDPCDGLQFDLVIGDEIQKIKNPAAGTSQAMKRLNSGGRRWGLSGTPYENRIDDVKSIFDFLRPGLLSLGPEPSRTVMTKIKPFFLRRTKEVLGDELPRKTQSVVWLELGGKQRAAYDLAEREGVVRLRQEGQHVTVTHVLALLGKLKEICNFDVQSGDSAKLDSLTDLLEDVTAERNKALVFTQYIAAGVDPIVRSLQRYNALEYSGRTNTDQKRKYTLDRFAKDLSCSVLVCTQAAAGLGINLTMANYVFHFDHWWNPARTSQAEDRVHRIGQQKPVFVYHFWVKNTVEERIFRILARKRAEFEELIGGMTNVEGSGLSEDELFELFDLKKPTRKREAVDAPQVARPPAAAQPEGPAPRVAPEIDAWPIIRETELTLRRAIRSELANTYGPAAVKRVFYQVGPDEATKIRARISETQRRYGSTPDFTPSDSPLDYLYLQQLVELISKEWPLFKPVFGEKSFLMNKLKDIAGVRNDEAHFRNIPQVERMRAYVACSDILARLKLSGA